MNKLTIEELEQKAMTEAIEMKPLPSCCPLCDNAIMEYEEVAIYFYAEAKSLAHLSCLEELNEDDQDE